MLPSGAVSVLDHGFVRLDDAMADDLSVVNAARVSFGRRVDLLREADTGLIHFLMRERHGTPFEHNAFRFHVKAPIFVTREWMRHRIGSFNEFSLRYAKAEPEFYVPNRMRTQVGKPGAYTFEDDQRGWFNRNWRVRLIEKYRHDVSLYEEMLDAGIARELASRVLPTALYTQFYWTLNARSLLNFISLRCAPQAQFEIRCYAKEIEDLFATKMPETFRAFVLNGRVAP